MVTKSPGRNKRVAERDALILEMIVEGRPYKEICERFGVDVSRCTFVRRRAGLPRRTTAGKPIPEERRRRQSETMKRKPPRSAEYRANIAKAKRGDNNGAWVGDAVGYGATHDWLRKNYGTPKHCEHCNGENAKSDVYNWAFLTPGGDHRRCREDYIRLCRSCHTRHDRYGMEVQCNYPLENEAA